MKSFLLFFFFILTTIASIAQVSQWSIMGGDNTTPQDGIYGTKGVAGNSNRPGARISSANWTDLSGNLWLFGGFGYGAASYGWLNDLWKYNISTRQWTWISGDDKADQYGVFYGKKGISSNSNKPGFRNSAMTWTDTSGNFWMFGGTGVATNGTGNLNDLWRYNTSSGLWTWVSGDTTINQHGIYQGSPERNVPGGRGGGVTWLDKQGDLWLFGGNGYSINGQGYISDLWKFSPVSNLWTWVGGPATANQAAVRGTKKVSSPANQPGSRSGATGWIDSSGKCWLFGGVISSINTIDRIGDTWRYDPSNNEWTWMGGDTTVNKPTVYGTKGVTGVLTTPGARQPASTYVDSANNLWLFGGYGNISGKPGYFNDLWKYDFISGEWSWMKGDSTIDNKGYYSAEGVEDQLNKPSSRIGTAAWSDRSGNFWLYGGGNTTNDFRSGNLNDLWRFNISTVNWIWEGGYNYNEQVGRYGVKGVSSPLNHPGGRNDATQWTDKEGNLWLFGGFGDASFNKAKMNDLWKYTVATGQWTWVTGDSTIYSPGNYGTKGVANPDNTPGARLLALGWTDTDGNLWLMGGNLFTQAIDGIKCNDLWKFSPATSLWTWMNGTIESGQPAVYGTIGVPAAANHPGARQAAVTWTDSFGDLYTFGGSGYSDTPGDDGNLGDLWRYNPNTNLWTWLGGSKGTAAKGIYGTKGTSDSGNKPGSRYKPVGWTDNSQNLWLFGGVGANSSIGLTSLNDLWKYNITTGRWTWVSGDNISSPYGVYGTKNVQATSNKPGGREAALAFNDKSGNLWLFGGSGNAGGNSGSMNDLWKYSISSNMWTWVSGDSLANDLGFYVAKGTPHPANKPGARLEANGWTDATGNFWLFGGFGGYQSTGRPYLNDLWRYSSAGITLSVKFTNFTAQKKSAAINLNWSTAAESVGTWFTVERSSNGFNFDSIGMVKITGNVTTITNYSFVDKTPLSTTSYYRLKQVDPDGKITYSVIAKVDMQDGIRFNIVQNPAQNTLALAIELPESQKFTLQILDMNGRLINSKDVTGKKGYAVYELPIENLPKGSYYITLRTLTLNGTRMFVK